MIMLKRVLRHAPFEAHLRAIPAVRSAAHVIGDVDYELSDDATWSGPLVEKRGSWGKLRG